MLTTLEKKLITDSQYIGLDYATTHHHPLPPSTSQNISTTTHHHSQLAKI